ncbi:unnamed protein product, partial [marine sediment metagenome]
MIFWALAVAWAIMFCIFRLLGGAYRPLSIMHLLSLPILCFHVYLESIGADPAPYILPLLMLNYGYAYNAMYEQVEKNIYQLTILGFMIFITFLAILDWEWRGIAIVEGWYFAVECLIVMSVGGGIYGLNRYLN